MYEKLFEPVQIDGMTVPSRLVFEPRRFYAELDGKARRDSLHAAAAPASAWSSRKSAP